MPKISGLVSWWVGGVLLHLPDEVGAIRGVAVRIDVSCEEVGVGGKQKGVGAASKIKSGVLL